MQQCFLLWTHPGPRLVWTLDTYDTWQRLTIMARHLLIKTPDIRQWANPWFSFNNAILSMRLNSMFGFYLILIIILITLYINIKVTRRQRLWNVSVRDYRDQLSQLGQLGQPWGAAGRDITSVRIMLIGAWTPPIHHVQLANLIPVSDLVQKYTRE